jgi:SAM-dependent methyltransferase
MKGVSLIPDSPLKARMREGTRRVLRLFGGRSNRDVEYDFAYRNVVGKWLRILDVGGCDSLLPIAFAKAGHMVTVYDFRPYPEHHPNLTVIQGDFLHNELSADSFDVAVMVSTLEHVGLGGYGAPECTDADFEIMKELRRILVDGGKAILTFPFNDRERIIPQFERWYTPGRLQRLFDGWFVLDVEFWVAEKKLFGRWVKWRPTTMQEAAQAYGKIGIQGVACFALCPRLIDWWER